MKLINRHRLLGAALLMLSQIAAAQTRDYVVRTERADQAQNSDPVYPAPPPKDDAIRPWANPQVRVQAVPANRRAAELAIGLYVSPVPPAMSAQLRLRRNSGAVVESVVPGSAAEKAGIQQYDVIERADGKPVNGPQQLPQLVSSHQAGDSIRFDIIREGNHRTIDVTIQNVPEAKPFYEYRPQDVRRFVPNLDFKFSPDQTRQLDEMTEKLRQEVQNQERQIEQLKENLRREADHARQELQQLKDQIRREVDQQKKQMLDELKQKDKAKQDKDDDKQERAN